jgi:hypothetical protein
MLRNRPRSPSFPRRFAPVLVAIVGALIFLSPFFAPSKTLAELIDSGEYCVVACDDARVLRDNPLSGLNTLKMDNPHILSARTPAQLKKELPHGTSVCVVADAIRFGRIQVAIQCQPGAPGVHYVIDTAHFDIYSVNGDGGLSKKDAASITHILIK